MNKLICQKCNHEISNESGITLAFCTNCGAKILIQENKAQTAHLPFLAEYNQGKKESLFDSWIMTVEDDDSDVDTEKWLKIVGIILVIVAVIFLPFLLAKEFKAKKMSEIQRMTSPTPEPSPTLRKPLIIPKSVPSKSSDFFSESY